MARLEVSNMYNSRKDLITAGAEAKLHHISMISTVLVLPRSGVPSVEVQKDLRRLSPGEIIIALRWSAGNS